MSYQDFFKGFVVSKEKEGCQGATAIFFMVRKAVKNMLLSRYTEDYLSFLTMKIIAEMMKVGDLNEVTERHQKVAFRYDFEMYHLPWVIEKIEDSNCDHKWCEIVREKLAEEDE